MLSSWDILAMSHMPTGGLEESVKLAVKHSTSCRSSGLTGRCSGLVTRCAPTLVLTVTPGCSVSDERMRVQPGQSSLSVNCSFEGTKEIFAQG